MSNSPDFLQYTVKKSVRESLVLGGSNNYLRAERRLRCERSPVIFYIPAIVKRGERTIVDQIGFSRVLGSVSDVAAEVVSSPAVMKGGAQYLVDRPGRPPKIPGQKKKGKVSFHAQIASDVC